MYRYVITGGQKLDGVVDVSGAKNASLPILAGSILTEEKVKLYNIPKIEDVYTTIDILKTLGCKVQINDKEIIIDSSNLNKFTITDELMRKLRSSVIIAGALISRMRKAVFSLPGGCNIGTRPIDLHINNFKKLGINVIENSGIIECSREKMESKTIELSFPSVGATENLILATVLGNSEVIIKNSAMEPEIIDLIRFLNKMGAKIYGAGTNTIKIVGVKKLSGTSFSAMPDRIEAGTLMVATAITSGEVLIKKVIPKHLTLIINILEKIGCAIDIGKNYIYIRASKRLLSTNIKTMPYPGFPTDLQPIFSALLTVCEGTSTVTENIFENRFKYMQELQKMGANVTYEGKKIIIDGVKYLTGTEVKATDLRGGAALVMAGLIALGVTKIDRVDYILRGYEELDKKLNLLGANIIRENYMEV